MDGYFIEPIFTKNGIPTSFEVDEQQYSGKMVTAFAHIHDKVEILYCMDGELKVFLNGEESLFNTGDMIIINSNEVHSVVSETDRVNRYIVVKIRPEILYDSMQAIFEMKYILPFTLSHSAFPQVLPKDILEKTIVPGLFDEIQLENEKKEYGYELAIRGCVCKLFLWILRYWRSQGLDIERKKDISQGQIGILKKAFDFVNTHYSENISALDIAKYCNVSYSYFSRMFKLNMGRSFTEYLSNHRISKAESLLTSTDKSISEIAIDTGFSDSGYFIKVFKQKKGISPRKFKKMYE